MKYQLKQVVLISLLLSVGLGQEAVNPHIMGTFKPKPYPDHPPDQPWPGIETFPEAIQEYDALRVQYFAWRQRPRADADSAGRAPEVDIPDALFYPLARAYTRTKLYYKTQKHDGEFDRYRDGHGGSGNLPDQIKKRLPPLWNVLNWSAGIALVEVFKDSVIERGGMSAPLGAPMDLVAHCKVVEDVLGTIEEDTVLVRHSTYWFNEPMSLSERPQLLLLLRGGRWAIVDDERINIYSAEYAFETKPQYMRVIDGIIRDSNETLGIVAGQMFEDYKSEIQNFLETEGLLP